MDVPTKPGDVLAQPTRARLFATLGELRRPVPTEELAELTGLHPNGVRVHLERLHAAGLLVRGRERRGRGRPRDTWSIDPAARPAGDPPTAYADLGRWLVRAITAGKTSLRQVETTGRAIGRELAAPEAAGTPEERLYGTLVSLGFQPDRVPGPGDRLTYCLGNCPYREAVREHQQVVCGLHRGITRGMLDEIEPSTKLTAFVPKDPDEAGCLIGLRGGAATEISGGAPG